MSLTVAVQTVPGREKSLADTLDSVEAAGFDRSEIILGVDVNRIGPHPMFLSLAADLLRRTPQAEWFLILQDDIRLTKGLAAILWDDLPTDGVVSLFTPGHARAQRSGPGWHRIQAMRGSYGAQALLWPGSLLRSYVASRPHPERRTGADHEILMFLRDRGLPWWYHCPSYCWHAGADDSTLATPGGCEAGRQATEWLPEAVVELGRAT